MKFFIKTMLFICLFLGLIGCDDGRVEVAHTPNGYESTGSFVYVNVSGDNAYVLDSITYSDNELAVVKSPTYDSASLRTLIAADTLAAAVQVNKWTLSQSNFEAQRAILDARITEDSTKVLFWTQRQSDGAVVIDSIIAN